MATTATTTTTAEAIAATAAAAGVTMHRGGTYLAMEGPQFSSLAESKMYREVWGCDVIGMTNMPEAKLAREAELCYASVAMITDYDSWHPDHGEIDVNEISRPELSSVLVAESIAEQLERRISWKRAMKQAVQKTMRAGGQGIMIRVSGRLGGADMGRVDTD